MYVSSNIVSFIYTTVLEIKLSPWESFRFEIRQFKVHLTWLFLNVLSKIWNLTSHSTVTTRKSYTYFTCITTPDSFINVLKRSSKIFWRSLDFYRDSQLIAKKSITSCFTYLPLCALYYTSNEFSRIIDVCRDL